MAELGEGAPKPEQGPKNPTTASKEHIDGWKAAFYTGNVLTAAVSGFTSGYQLAEGNDRAALFSGAVSALSSTAIVLRGLSGR